MRYNFENQSWNNCYNFKRKFTDKIILYNLKSVHKLNIDIFIRLNKIYLLILFIQFKSEIYSVYAAFYLFELFQTNESKEHQSRLAICMESDYAFIIFKLSNVQLENLLINSFFFYSLIIISLNIKISINLNKIS